MKVKAYQYRRLTWAESQAKQLLGVHIGGPNEAEYRALLKDLRKILLEIKPKRYSS